MPMCFSNNEQNISRRTVRSAGKHEPVDSMEALQMTVIDQISNAHDNKEYIRFESRKKKYKFEMHVNVSDSIACA